MEDNGFKICSGIELLDSVFLPQLGSLYVIGKALVDDADNGISVGDIVSVRVRRYSGDPKEFAAAEINRISGINNSVSKLKLEHCSPTWHVVVQDGQIIKHYISVDGLRSLITPVLNG